MKSPLLSFLIKLLLPILSFYFITKYLGEFIGVSLFVLSLLYFTYYLIFFFEKKEKKIHDLNIKGGDSIFKNKVSFNFKNLIINTGIILLSGIFFYGFGNALFPDNKVQHQEISKPQIRKKKEKKKKSTNDWDHKERTNPNGHGRKKQY